GPDAVASWVAEAKDYDYASNTCAPGKVCGHYTQVVWRATEKLGCAVYTCAALTFKSTIVCDYGPGGNTGGKPREQLGGARLRRVKVAGDLGLALRRGAAAFHRAGHLEVERARQLEVHLHAALEVDRDVHAVLLARQLALEREGRRLRVLRGQRERDVRRR